jgi:hypothetical protein
MEENAMYINNAQTNNFISIRASYLHLATTAALPDLHRFQDKPRGIHATSFRIEMSL